ncbi:P-loop NTPase family protein [Nesterenkonia ebinurensis]|uniref:kinase n=1 Tax=Nesterenkonia ebinurensis TaxID=2608252 RepID=UPI001CC3BA33|nr:kinase [Nesterenkonia ebinurensis]
MVIRGNSGSGKSALAAAIRAARPRGVAVIGQDLLRREILRVKEEPGTPAAEYIALSARFALDHGLHVIVEGILYAAIYGDVLRELIADHRGMTLCYRYDLPFDETLRRHRTKPSAGSFGEEEMRRWWRDSDPLEGVSEEIIGLESTLAESTARVLTDCGWDRCQWQGAERTRTERMSAEMTEPEFAAF